MRADSENLARGAVRASVDVEFTRSNRERLRPTTLAPNVHFGLTDDVTLGVVHSGRSLGLVSSGNGICVADCDSAYRTLGLDARYRWYAATQWTLSSRLVLLSQQFEPFHPAVVVAARVEWAKGRVAIHAEPQLSLGLSARHKGNGDRFNLPMWFSVAIGPVTPYLFLAVETPVRELRDRYDIPVAIGVRTRLYDRPRLGRLSLGLQYGFPRLLGAQNAPNYRNMVVFFTWHGQVGSRNRPR